jgi:hypothetical protein
MLIYVFDSLVRVPRWRDAPGTKLLGPFESQLSLSGGYTFTMHWVLALTVSGTTSFGRILGHMAM